MTLDRPIPWAGGRWRELVSVWTTGQQGESTQLRDGYSLEIRTDTQRIPPAIAAHAITHYSHPGALVVDPDCGAGTVLVEALRAGRHAVGQTSSLRSWRIARANVTAAKHRGAWPDGMVIDTSPTGARRILDAGLIHRADLVLTTIRIPASLSPDPDSDLESRIRPTVHRWTSLLRPGGHAVIILRPYRSRTGALVDLPTAVSTVAAAAGLIVIDRCVALTAALRGSHVELRVSIKERRAADSRRAAGTPTALVAHYTALILKASDVIEHRNGGVPRTETVLNGELAGRSLVRFARERGAGQSDVFLRGTRRQGRAVG
jgi:modification methylase